MPTLLSSPWEARARLQAFSARPSHGAAFPSVQRMPREGPAVAFVVEPGDLERLRGNLGPGRLSGFVRGVEREEGAYPVPRTSSKAKSNIRLIKR